MNIAYLLGYAKNLHYYTRNLNNSAIDLEISISNNNEADARKYLASLQEFEKGVKAMIGELEEELIPITKSEAPR